MPNPLYAALAADLGVNESTAARIGRAVRALEADNLTLRFGDTNSWDGRLMWNNTATGGELTAAVASAVKAGLIVVDLRLTEKATEILARATDQRT